MYSLSYALPCSACTGYCAGFRIHESWPDSLIVVMCTRGCAAHPHGAPASSSATVGQAQAPHFTSATAEEILPSCNGRGALTGHRVMLSAAQHRSKQDPCMYTYNYVITFINDVCMHLPVSFQHFRLGTNRPLSSVSRFVQCLHRVYQASHQWSPSGRRTSFSSTSNLSQDCWHQ